MQRLVAHRDPTAGPSFEDQCGCRIGGVLRGRSPTLFGRIDDPAVELIILERSLPAELGCWLDGLPPHQLPDGRVLVSEADLPAAITALLQSSGTPDGPMRDALQRDVLYLATVFLTTMATDTIDIRLEVIQHDACWRFHRDCVEARLLTTYRGPGTQWVSPGCSATAIAQQESYQGPLHEFPRYAVGLFKGSCAESATGIVHRSPPVAGTGTTRLLLCLNLPSAASPDLWEPS